MRFGDRELREMIVGYLDRLSIALSRLNSLSASGVDLATTERVHQRLVKTVDEQAHEIDESRSADELNDLDIFVNWFRSPDRSPMLIVGEFGSGKSGLLTVYTLELADRLRKALNASAQSVTEIITAAPLPLPVRLRTWPTCAGEDVSAANVVDRWRLYLHRSQTDMYAGLRGILPAELLDWMLDGSPQRVLPLFDGFDELPDDLEPFVGRSQTLERIEQSFEGSRFVLATRPGYGAEGHRLFRGRRLRFSLGGLRSPDVDRFIQRSLEPDAIKLQLAQNAYEELKPLLGVHLRKPLFLALWVVSIASGDPLPQTTEDLMEVAYRSCFDARLRERKTPGFHQRIGRSNELDHQIAQNRRLLGHLLMVFGNRQFSTATDREIAVEIRASETFTEEAARDITGVADHLGLLIRLGPTRWRAVKVPVVEYLIGRAVAGMACGSHEERQQLVRIFRRWVWMPSTHESFDFMFDIMGRTSMPLAENLIEWLLKTDELGSAEGTVATCNDFGRPFSFLAVRWFDAACSQNGELLTRIARRLAEYPRLLGTFLPTTLRASSSTQVFKQLIAAMQDPRWRARNKSWCGSLNVVAQHVSAASAADMIRQWLTELRQCDEAEAARATWISAIVGAASSVAEDAAVKLLGELVAASAMDFSSVALMDAWRDSVSRCAERVAPSAVLPISRDWIANARRTDLSLLTRRLWRCAVANLGGRLRTCDVTAFVMALLDEQSELDQLDEDRGIWWSGIWNATLLSYESTAPGVVREWLRQFQIARTPIFRSLWETIILHNLMRLPQEIVAGVGLELPILREISQPVGKLAKVWDFVVHRAEGNWSDAGMTDSILADDGSGPTEEIRAMWLRMLWSVCARLEPNLAPHFVLKIVKLRQSSDQCPEALDCLFEAMLLATAALRPSDAPKLVSDLIASYPLSASSALVDKFYSDTIASVAARIPSCNAAELVRTWVAEFDGPNLAEEVQALWAVAVATAAEHVPQSASGDVQYVWVAEWQRTDSSASVKSLWRFALSRLASNVSEPLLARALIVYMLKIGWHHFALDVASRVSSVALTNELCPVADIEMVARSGNLAVHVRSDPALILSTTEHCTPLAIREILQPFPLAEGLNPEAQWELLSAEIVRRRTHRRGLPSGSSAVDQKNRSNWRDAFRVLAADRGLLDPRRDVMEHYVGGSKQIYVRRERFLASLQVASVVETFIQSRKSLK